MVNSGLNSEDHNVATTCRLIDDPHEWYNDCPTVSNIAFVKLDYL